MFKSYIATPEDFLAVEDALRYVWHPKLDFIFRKKKSIRSTVVISYDSQCLYVWTQKKFPGFTRMECSVKDYYAYRIPQRFIFTKEHHSTWWAGVHSEIDAFLPEAIKRQSQFSIPRISGGLLTPFIAVQKTLQKKHNPYTTRESYLATIVHEFGHVYWNQYKLWWYSNKEENLRYLKTALRCYSNKKSVTTITRINLPVHQGIGEAYATCTELAGSTLFWPTHKKAFDKFFKYLLSLAIQSEYGKDLEREDSTLEPSRDAHIYGTVIGNIILAKFPKDWPTILTHLHFNLAI